MKFDRKTFFDSVRPDPFPNTLSQDQVDGMEAILSRWENSPQYSDIRHLAYMLATTYHETAATMQPITEYGSQDYLEGKDYYPYIGRGYVQLTWEDNYAKATAKLGLRGSDDLVIYPDRALDPQIAADVMFVGMAEGWFTSRKLSDYFNSSKDDPLNARQIINGNDDDDLIKGYHFDFLDALTASEQVIPEPPDVVAGVADIAITVSEGVTLTIAVNGKAIKWQS